jgi:DNA-binding response OmpR family regulator
MTTPGARPLLLIDPDSGIRDSLGDQLEQEGFVTVRLARLAEAQTRPDLDAALILLGPGAVEDEVLESWQPQAPILALLDPGQEEAVRSRSFAARLVRPVRIAELVETIRRLMRQRQAGTERAIGPYWVQPTAKLLRDPAGGRTVRLTEKEVAMLELLCEAGAGGITRERLLAEVWGYSRAVSTHTLETHIYRLRQKIERDPADAQILLTEPGGYRLAL